MDLAGRKIINGRCTTTGVGCVPSYMVRCVILLRCCVWCACVCHFCVAESVPIPLDDSKFNVPNYDIPKFQSSKSTFALPDPSAGRRG